mgnify:CR=1 FL=1
MHLQNRAGGAGCRIDPLSAFIDQLAVGTNIDDKCSRRLLCNLDGARPRTWYPDNLRGRQFAQFVSLGYHCFLTKKIKEVQAKLRKKEPGKTKSLIKLEKKLENWLAQRSLAQILDWFDCIETTKVQTVMGSYRWSTESVARDRLLLKYLGVGTK